MRDKLKRILSRARYAAIGAAIGGGIGGLLSTKYASTGAALGALVGATVGEKRVDVESRVEEFKAERASKVDIAADE